MSRIGTKIITVPQGVKIDVRDGSIFVEGPKGKLSQKIHSSVTAKVESNTLSFARKDNEIQSRAAHGTIRSIVANMIKGVTDGFTRELDITGVGYKAELKGQNLELHLGFSYPRVYPIPQGIKAEVEKQIRIKLHGIDKMLVGKVASELRKIRPPEPYKGKGIKYAGEIIKKKVGKTAVTQAT
jgi:large subunit ribosomal protein L6